MKNARQHLFILIIAVVLSGGCGSVSELSSDCPSSEGAPDRGEYMFEWCTSLTVAAKTSEFEIGEEIEIIFECNPIFSGTGVLQAQILGGGSVVVDAPRTWRESEKRDFFGTQAEFTADERFSMTWIVRVFAERDHHIYAYARVDSVSLGDSLVARDSDQATAVFGPLSSRPAANYPALVLRPSRQSN